MEILFQHSSNYIYCYLATFYISLLDISIEMFYKCESMLDNDPDIICSEDEEIDLDT